MPIKQIVYVSEEAVDFDKAGLVTLLTKARENNAKDNVTGVLLHSPGLFAQCLEGQSDVVEGLFKKILADPRHVNIVRLNEIVVPARCFSDWSMGCVDVPAVDIRGIKAADWNQAIEEHKDRPWISPGFALMEGLWNMHRSRRF